MNIQLWGGRRLEWHPSGYWAMKPMPSEEELSVFYENIYWIGMGGKACCVGYRDLDHFVLVQQLFPEKQFRRILNFGAGHGGISVLFHCAGAKVVNVEPSAIDLPINVEHERTLNAVEGKFDLIYGSHSLEHVTDVTVFFQEVDRLLENDGVVFMEVPNCHAANPESFPADKVAPPHTYYFTRAFFDTLPYETVMNGTFWQRVPRYVAAPNEEGEAIRWCGRKKASA